MKDTKKVVAAIANHSRMLDAYMYCRRRATKSHIAILVYHHIAPETHSWFLNPLSPETFKNQLEYLCRHYEVISLDKLVQCIEHGIVPPQKAVVLTFDDGYRNNYIYAYPILRQCNVPATIFLTTRPVDAGELFWWDKARYAIHQTNVRQLELNGLGSYSLESESQRSRASIVIVKRLKQVPEELKNVTLEKLFSLPGVDIGTDLGKKFVLSWEEVREMSNNGISFGAHSVTHPILTNVSLEQAWREISQSKKIIEENLGKEVTAFGYPNGDFNLEIAELVRKARFTCAVSTSPHLINRKDNLYTLGRIGGDLDPHRFKVVFSGLYGDIQHLLAK